MIFFEKRQALRPLLFVAASIFVYGGSVNYGAFDFLPAVPFLVFVLYAAWKWKGNYAAACSLLALVCTPLYVLKGEHGALFHPSLGRELRTTADTCLTLYRISGQEFVIMTELQGNCDSSNKIDAVKWEILPKGSKLTVDAVSVSNADFGEDYVVHSKVPLGNVRLYPSFDKIFAWLDGSRVKQSDLRRPEFYYPSLLMYWPIVIMTPFFIAQSLLRLFG